MPSKRALLELGLLLLTAVAAPRPADAQTPDLEKIAEAKRHMEAGAALYNDPSGHKCEEALREFKKAYELSGSLNALKAMGVCELEIERDGDAIAHFEKFLEKLGDKPHPDREQVETDLRTLKSAVAWITLSADRPNVRVVDTRTPAKGYPITNRYTVSSAGVKLGIHPGQHVFTASSDGAPDLVWKIDIVNGSTQSHMFEFDAGKPLTAEGFDMGPSEAPTERPVPLAVYVFGGMTMALAVPMTIFMVRASAARTDYDEANGSASAATLNELRSDVTSSNLLADVFLGATVLSAVTTGVFYFTRPEVPATSTSSGWRLTPAVGPGGPGAVLHGRF